MLQQIRGALKGAAISIVILVAFAAFAFTDVPSITQLGSNAALKVGDEQFSSRYIENEFNRTLQVRRQETGGNFTRDDAIATGLADQVIDSIATTAALAQFTDRLGLAMPRELVGDYLRQNENFQNPATGQFDRFVLESILQRNSMTVEEFESRVSEDLLRQQLITSLANAGPAPVAMLDAALLRQTERRRIAYLTVTDEMAGEAAEPTPEDLQSYYDANISEFTAPEYRVFDLVLLEREDFADDLSVDEEELRQIYDMNRERLYEEPEKRTLYQLTYETEVEAQAAVASLRQKETFESLAEDRGLGMDAVTFTDAQARDILDPSVSEAAFAEGLGEGAILDPVQSLFGWTVVQIAGVTPPVSRSFDEVRDEIEAQFLDNDTRRLIFAAIDTIEEERDTGASLADAAQEAELPIQTVGPIDRFSFAPGGAIIDAIPGEALNEAFQLEEGDESQALDYDNQQNYLFVALREVIAPAPIPFEDVRERVEEGWRNQERDQRISATVRQIRDAVAGGKTLREAADELDRAPIEIVIDRRFENEVISRLLNEQIFFADLGDLVSGPTSAGPSQAVAEVTNITFARNTIPPNEEEMFKQYLGYQLDQELLEAFVTEIRDDYGVRINRDQLSTLYSDDL